MRFCFALLVLIASLGLAQPRVGTENNLTRIAFTITAQASYKVSRSGNSLAVRFSGTPRRTGSALWNTPQVVGYKVTPTSNGALYSFTLKSGTRYRTYELKAGSRRLVIEVSRGSSKVKPPPARANQATVVLDPGHGGKFPGAQGFVSEKVITLDIVLRTKRLLEARGIKVVLTRDQDEHLSTNLRSDLAHRAEMANSHRNLFVSVHANSSVKPSRGIEVYYFGDTIDQSLLAKAILENGGGEVGRRLTTESRGIANQLLRDLIAQANLSFSQKLASTLLGSLIDETGTIRRGVHTAPFYVIRYARIPAVLVEVGFVNHPVEGKNLGIPSYRQKLARGLADGISAFLKDGNVR